MFQISYIVILDLEIPSINLRDEGKSIQILDGRPIGSELNSVVFPECNAGDIFEGYSIRHLNHRILKLSSDDKVYCLACRKGFRRQHHGMGPDEANPDTRKLILQSFRHPRVVGQGGSARMNDDKLVPTSFFHDSVGGHVGGRRVEETALGHKTGGIRQPGWVPKGADLP